MAAVKVNTRRTRSYLALRRAMYHLINQRAMTTGDTPREMDRWQQLYDAIILLNTTLDDLMNQLTASEWASVYAQIRGTR